MSVSKPKLASAGVVLSPFFQPNVSQDHHLCVSVLTKTTRPSDWDRPGRSRRKGLGNEKGLGVCVECFCLRGFSTGANET